MNYLLLGQVPQFETVAIYAFVSIIYLSLATIAYRLTREISGKLILVGMFTAAAAIGYGSLLIAGAVVLAPTMMRIAFLLVLGGLASHLLTQKNAGCAEQRKDGESRATAEERS